MSFKVNSLYLSDGYKVGHKAMLAPGTTRLYGTWIPRSVKHAPKGITKIVSFGQQLVWKWLHDEFEENFFFTKSRNINFNHKHANQELNKALKNQALQFIKGMSLYLGMEYDGEHFEQLHDLGYLPIKVKALPEGIETNPNIPHMTFVNTVDGFAWLTLYLETVVSSLAWKPSTAATIAKLYRRQTEEWVAKTDKDNMWLVDFMCHDFSARGLDPMSQYLIGLGHATSFKGSDTLPVIPASRYFYGVKENEMPIGSVNASEHSVSCTNIFYYEVELKVGEFKDKIEEYYSFDLPADGDINNPDYLAIAEWLMLRDWLKKFPKGILSYVCDTFNTWKSATHIVPRLKKEIMEREGKLVLRPDSGDPVDIICGIPYKTLKSLYDFTGEIGDVIFVDNKFYKATNIIEEHFQGNEYSFKEVTYNSSELKGVIELLWDIFGGTINEQGFKVLNPHIGAIYGDSITPERQVQIYERLAAKGFAATNIVLGIGSFTYQYNTRDTLGFAAKGAWFEVAEPCMEERCLFHTCNSKCKKSYNIYKDPVTDDGTKKSLKGLCAVSQDKNGEYVVQTECTPEEENQGLLQVIYEDGRFYNTTTLEEIRKRLSN